MCHRRLHRKAKEKAVKVRMVQLEVGRLAVVAGHLQPEVEGLAVVAAAAGQLEGEEVDGDEVSCVSARRYIVDDIGSPLSVG